MSNVTNDFVSIPGDVLTDPSQLNQFIKKDNQEGKYYCAICKEVSNRVITHVRNHLEAKHFPSSFVYTCPICNEQFNTAISFNNHKARKHKQDYL